MNIAIRQATVEDLPFIFNSWLKAYKHSSLFAKRIKHETFFKYHHAVIERILSRCPSMLVATPHDDAHTILGYIIAEALDVPTLHFCYVKAPFRKFGVGKQLLASAMLHMPSDMLDFTHWTRDCDWIVERLSTLNYNPYKL